MRILHLAILRAAGLLVPGPQRAEWLAEWRSELWYARPSGGHMDATAFCLGAFQDALWLRRNGSRCKLRDIFPLDSPSRCLFLLAAFAAIGLLIALHRPRPTDPSPFRAFLLIVGLACLIVPATTPLSLGDYPASRHAPSMAIRLRRWVFLAAKIVLILPMVYAGTLLPASNLLIQTLLWGCAFAFRWVLRDQRKRCPVCLRLLTNPVRVGQRAGWFLEWNCTELMCLRGHGMLNIPENPTSWFGAPLWLYLDSSWSGL